MPLRRIVPPAAALGALAVLAAGSAALAQASAVPEIVVRPPPRAPDADTPSETVRFGDLDISQPRGAEILVKRIRRAATHVCAAEKVDWNSNPTYRACLRKAASEAVAAVGNPVVSAAYAGRR